MKAVPQSMAHTRRVRAWNVRVGDELSFFDSKARRERIMVVVSVNLTVPGVQQLGIRYKRNGKCLWRWNMKRNDLVRVRRAR